MNHGVRAVIAAGSAAAAAALAYRYGAMRDAVAEAAPELRNPLLPILTLPVTARTLPIIRLFMRIRTTSGRGRGVTITKSSIATSLPVVVISPHPAGEKVRPALLWLHGGGFVAGSPQGEAKGAAGTARDLDAVVVSPDYRLAPEHPFPAGLDDCMTTLRWMHERSEELGIDPARIAVVGTSAGGGLAASVAQRAHDDGLRVCAQGLIAPMLDDRTTLRSSDGRGQLVWTPNSNMFGWTAYLGRRPRMSDAPEYAAPARREDLSGLAPAWVGVGELDLFHDEAVEYASKLIAAGVCCELMTIPGMYHSGEFFAARAPIVEVMGSSLMRHLRSYLHVARDQGQRSNISAD